MNEFERKLEQQPLRPIPREWKAEIFAALDGPAQRPVSSSAGSDSERFVGTTATVEGGQPLRFQVTALREWLWPSPAAWAALLALWVGLLTLYFSAPQTGAVVTTQHAKPLTSAPRGSLLAFQTQHGLAAEVAGMRHQLQ